MSKIITISITEESLKLFNEIAEREYTDRSKLVRRWIKEHYNKKQEE